MGLTANKSGGKQKLMCDLSPCTWAKKHALRLVCVCVSVCVPVCASVCQCVRHPTYAVTEQDGEQDGQADRTERRTPADTTQRQIDQIKYG